MKVQIKETTVYEAIVNDQLTDEEILEMIDDGDIILDGWPVSSEFQIVG